VTIRGLPKLRRGNYRLLVTKGTGARGKLLVRRVLVIR
jgi:hypothetical protein